jgi:hypothetical protein
VGVLSEIVRVNVFATEYVDESTWEKRYPRIVTRCITHYLSHFEHREYITPSDYKYEKKTRVATSILCSATRYFEHSGSNKREDNKNNGILPGYGEVSPSTITVPV